MKLEKSYEKHNHKKAARKILLKSSLGAFVANTTDFTLAAVALDSTVQLSLACRGTRFLVTGYLDHEVLLKSNCLKFELNLTAAKSFSREIH